LETKELGKRRGFPIFNYNPCLAQLSEFQTREQKPAIVKDTKAIIFNDSTGEVTGQGSIAFLEREEVDAEKFVKVYINGFNSIFRLVKSGKTMFKLIWFQVHNNPNTDRVELTHLIAEKYGLDASMRTVNRGIKELLEKEFIFNSTAPNLFYFNTDYIFNGNRIVTAKQYDLIPGKQQISETKQ
jgi:hypothetical protein